MTLVVRVIREPDGQFSAFVDRDNKPLRFARGKTEGEALERAGRRLTKGDEIDASLKREDAYWRRVGGQSPVGSTGNDRRP